MAKSISTSAGTAKSTTPIAEDTMKAGKAVVTASPSTASASLAVVVRKKN